jgi:hypothetical protein
MKVGDMVTRVMQPHVDATDVGIVIEILASFRVRPTPACIVKVMWTHRNGYHASDILVTL